MFKTLKQKIILIATSLPIAVIMSVCAILLVTKLLVNQQFWVALTNETIDEALPTDLSLGISLMLFSTWLACEFLVTEASSKKLKDPLRRSSMFLAVIGLLLGFLAIFT